MGRTVVTQKDVQLGSLPSRPDASAGAATEFTAPVATAAGQTPDNYRDRLLKYIPAEIVAIYLALLGVLKAVPPDTTPIATVQWVVFAAIVLISVPWQRKIMKITKWQQVAIGSVAFIVWAISLGEPFDTTWQAWYQPVYGTMVMMLYTFLIPLFEAES